MLCTISETMVLLNMVANILARVSVKVAYYGFADRVASPKGTPGDGVGETRLNYRTIFGKPTQLGTAELLLVLILWESD
jgi:hypothetical protein